MRKQIKIQACSSPSIEDAFKDFLLHKKASGIAEKTLRSYSQQFSAVSKFIDSSVTAKAKLHFEFSQPVRVADAVCHSRSIYMDTTKNNAPKYEYVVETVTDRIGGGIDLAAVDSVIQARARIGWRLVTIFTNELGKDALSMGRLGVNSTIDQSILVFEREIKQPEPIQLRANAGVSSSNIVSPFFPKAVSLFESKGTLHAVLKVLCEDGFILKSLQGDLVVYNIFKDSVVLKDVCFFSFDKCDNGYYESSPFPVSLPDKIIYGVSDVSLSIKKYISNDELVIVDDTKHTVDVKKNYPSFVDSNGFWTCTNCGSKNDPECVFCVECLTDR